MSHFTLLVAVGADKVKDDDPANIQDVLGTLLAPYDESLEVEPYRDYELGEPGDFWWVSSVRRGARYHQGVEAPPPIDDYERKYRGVTEDSRGREYEQDAKWAANLGDDPSWADVVREYNAFYHPAAALAKIGDDSDEGRLLLEEETGRAYTMSTRNENGLWDWWLIGGRWHREVLLAKQGVDKSVLVFGREGSFSMPEQDQFGPNGGVRCDGAQLRHLDLAAIRDAAADKAEKEWAQWQDVTAQHADAPAPKGWASHYRPLLDAGEIDVDVARAEYHAQLVVKEFNKRDRDRWAFGGCPVDHFRGDRDAFVHRTRMGALRSFAFLREDGTWVAPGRMGWFGISDESQDGKQLFQEQLAAHLEGLDPSTWLVLLDLHT